MPTYDDLSAVFINTSLKRSREPSHTQMLMDVAIGIMEAQGVKTTTLRAADLDIPPGVQPDMTEHGWDSDGWPAVQKQEAGPGPSYGDDDKAGGKVGLDNEFTQRNTTFMAWNLMHMARMLKDAGGIPAHGNQKAAWDRGERFDHPNPEYR